MLQRLNLGALRAGMNVAMGRDQAQGCQVLVIDRWTSDEYNYNYLIINYLIINYLIINYLIIIN